MEGKPNAPQPSLLWRASLQAVGEVARLRPRIPLSSKSSLFIRWGWGGHGDYLDAIDILVDRGSGYTHLVTDTTPNYIDSTPLPATAQKWTYKAIFKVGDARVGQWSDEVSITVGG